MVQVMLQASSYIYLLMGDQPIGINRRDRGIKQPYVGDIAPRQDDSVRLYIGHDVLKSGETLCRAQQKFAVFANLDFVV